jgi:D-3-phosphoglycerate dehydrogenase
MKKILVSAPMEFVELDNRFSLDKDLIVDPLLNTRDIESLQDRDSVYSWVVSPCPTYLIDSKVASYFPNLKSVVTPSTGTNHIAREELENQGVKVFSLRNSKLYNTILASSEYSFSLLLSLVRKIPEASKFAVEGKWRESEKFLRSRELNNLTLGIVGLGRIGANVAKYASSMDISIQYYDPFVDNKSLNRLDSIEELLSSSDVVLLSLILDSSTEGLLDANILSCAKKGLLLVNTSRGEVIDEYTVAKMIRSGALGGYATDVLSGEIDGSWKGSPILDLVKEDFNVIITPHIAGLTIDSESKAQNIALNLAADNMV